MRKKTAVLVVEDSLTVRKHLVAVLSSDPELEVAGEAADGKTAIELCQRLRPDVITLDIQLPVLSGLAVTEYVMAYCPTPILIVSASTNRGNSYKAYDALAAGAVDILEKPAGPGTDAGWEQVFLARVKMVSRIKVITHLSGRFHKQGGRLTTPASPIHRAIRQPPPYRVVAMGASTGGPAAVASVLRSLPRDFPLGVLLVIHIAEAFGAQMADWLDSHSRLRVSCCRDGEPLPEIGQGRVILAPPGRHMLIRGGALHLSDEAERHSCRPSVDVLFESLAREIGPQTIACLMTGMGRDGAGGLLAVRLSAGRTLVQDEATSIAFGMPQEAIRLGAAERVIALDEFAPVLMSMAADCRPVRNDARGMRG